MLLAEYAAAFDKSPLPTSSDPIEWGKRSLHTTKCLFLSPHRSLSTNYLTKAEVIALLPTTKSPFLRQKGLMKLYSGCFGIMSWWFRFLVAQKYESLVTYIQ